MEDTFWAPIKAQLSMINKRLDRCVKLVWDLLGRTSGFGQRGDRRNGEFSIEESSELYSYVTVGAQ